MIEVWDIQEREVESASLNPLGDGWRLKVQSSRDEQREREALGIGSARSQDDATTGASPSVPVQRV